MNRRLVLFALGAAVISGTGAGPVQQQPGYTRTRDIIYGRKAGLALTMDVFAPERHAKGLAVVSVVSGGWFSGPEVIVPELFEAFIKNGYTVFAVIHGSQPKFTVDEMIVDVDRAVRFIRCHAADYKIDRERIAIMGGSAGGHLALLQAMTGGDGNPKSADPIERVSSRVQAAAAFFAPTDFLNYGGKGIEKINRDLPAAFTAAIDYHEFDNDKRLYQRVTDRHKLRDISRQVSPIYHVTADSPPTLLIHGDKDWIVPCQQSESLYDRLTELKVPAELVIRKDAGHGWATMVQDIDLFAAWFDKHLAKK